MPLHERPEALQELPLAVQVRRHDHTGLGTGCRGDAGRACLGLLHDRIRSRAGVLEHAPRLGVEIEGRGIERCTLAPQLHQLGLESLELLGDLVEELVDVALVVAAEGDPELLALHVRGGEAPAGLAAEPARRGSVLVLHGCPHLFNNRAPRAGPRG